MRTWKVGHNKIDGKLVKYFITDAEDNDELDERPIVAEFPISQKFDKETQQERANAYADYMNKVAEATVQAYQNNQLIDILKAP
jgi:hypothetical protein